MSGKVFMYGDQETINILNLDLPKVILFGGYLGYSNFGDILQLKEAIKFHTTITTLEPVVICNLSAIPDKDFLVRLRNWFGVRAIIFVEDHPVDVTVLNMHVIDNFFPIQNLHVYGGGFLNRYWGDHFLKLIEGLLGNFRVDNYVIGGQQIDAELRNRLKFHFEKYRPKLIGARDVESQNIINSMGFTCEFSFDDASDIIMNWTRRKPVNNSADESLFIHLNTSKYTWDKSEEHRKELKRITLLVKEVTERFSVLKPVFLNAYSEYRLSVKDTLATIISLEDALPFLDYRVVDIAHMALLHDPFSTAIDSNLAVFPGGVGISSSYHATLFCNMLNIPCYLLSDNPYYNQKKGGLGENRTLEQFLENPSVLSYSNVIEQRGVWLKKLVSAFENVYRSPVRNKISFNYNYLDFSRVPFCFKEASKAEIENYSLRGELARAFDTLKDKIGRIDHLERELGLSKRGATAEGKGLSMRSISLLRNFLGFKRK